MLSTVKLDHELFFKADEIDDIHSHWLLWFEFQTQQSFRPEILSKELFRTSRSFSQIFCELDVHFTIPPSPCPTIRQESRIGRAEGTPEGRALGMALVTPTLGRGDPWKNALPITKRPWAPIRTLVPGEPRFL
jgi:hypothetical protein